MLNEIKSSYKQYPTLNKDEERDLIYKYKDNIAIRLYDVNDSSINPVTGKVEGRPLCEKLVKNASRINDIKLLAGSYPENACSQLIVLLDAVKEKIKFNANVNLVVDKMLLNILEVKHKCKK